MTDRQIPSLMLITGGVRSGKSTFAEKVATESGRKVVYIATARPGDDEMVRRIAEHRLRRSPDVLTVEEYYSPHLVLAEEDGPDKLFLLDCLTILSSNHLLKYLDENAGKNASEDLYSDRRLLEESAAKTMEYMRLLADCAHKTLAPVVVVTNEVGMGVVPDNALGRTFRDLAGRVNQHFASIAGQVWLVVCGIPKQIK